MGSNPRSRYGVASNVHVAQELLCHAHQNWVTPDSRDAVGEYAMLVQENVGVWKVVFEAHKSLLEPCVLMQPRDLSCRVQTLCKVVHEHLHSVYGTLRGLKWQQI